MLTRCERVWSATALLNLCSMRTKKSVAYCLSKPFFYSQDERLTVPACQANIVRCKIYDLASVGGCRACVSQKSPPPST